MWNLSPSFHTPTKQPFQHGRLVTLLLDHFSLVIQQVMKGGGRGKIKAVAGVCVGGVVSSVLKPVPSGERGVGNWYIQLRLCLLDFFFFPFGSINRPEAEDLIQNLNPPKVYQIDGKNVQSLNTVCSVSDKFITLSVCFFPLSPHLPPKKE